MEDQEEYIPLDQLLASFEECSTKELNIMAIGEAGVGKSSLINGIFGREVSLENPDESETAIIQHIPLHSPDSPPEDSSILNLYDTPGLEDSENKEMDEEYLSKICGLAQKIDLFILCINMREPRFKESTKRTIQKFSERIANFESRTIVAFTFANEVKKPLQSSLYQEHIDYFNGRLNKKIEFLLKQMPSLAKERIIPVGYWRLEKKLPFYKEDEEWLASFWLTILISIQDPAKLALFFRVAPPLYIQKVEGGSKTVEPRFEFTEEQRDKLWRVLSGGISILSSFNPHRLLAFLSSKYGHPNMNPKLGIGFIAFVSLLGVVVGVTKTTQLPDFLSKKVEEGAYSAFQKLVK